MSAAPIRVAPDATDGVVVLRWQVSADWDARLRLEPQDARALAAHLELAADVVDLDRAEPEP